MENAFSSLRSDEKLQSTIHDLALGLELRQLASLPNQIIIENNVGSTHSGIIHQFMQYWCILGANPFAFVIPNCCRVREIRMIREMASDCRVITEFFVLNHLLA